MAAENTSVEIRDDRDHGKLVARLDGIVAGTIAYFAMYPAPRSARRRTHPRRAGVRGPGHRGCAGLGVLSRRGP